MLKASASAWWTNNSLGIVYIQTSWNVHLPQVIYIQIGYSFPMRDNAIGPIYEIRAILDSEGNPLIVAGFDYWVLVT
jgi:hypothetical protein